MFVKTKYITGDFILLKCLFFLVSLVIILLMPLPGFAQFNVFSWNNFEDGVFPENLKREHSANVDNVNIFDFSSPQAPAALLEGVAKSECGRYGLRFLVSREGVYIKVASNVTLDRKNLGTMGKALYQADIYLSENSADLPYSAAVMAEMPNPDPKKASYSFYRFGIQKGDSVFFSYTNNTPQPLIYKLVKIDQLQLKRPGWHRFQIIFDGQENIICAVDGKATSFSPIQEPTLDMLRAGFMVSSSTTGSGTCYVDNLSIQWTNENIELPDSPWAPPPGGEDAGQTSLPAPQDSSAPPLGSIVAPLSSTPSVSDLKWTSSPEDAWQMSASQNRPFLILFYAPRVNAYKSLEQFLGASQPARAFLNQFFLLRLDINQLRGGTIAQQFQVNKVPCFVLVGKDGKERAKEYFRSEADWNALSQNLKKALSQ